MLESGNHRIRLIRLLHNFNNLTFNNMIHSYDTRNKNNLHLPHIRTNWGKQRFSFHAAKTHWILKQENYHRCLDLNLD